jgi:hypothetical protein
MADHFRVNIPVRNDKISYKFKTLLKLFFSPAGNKPVNPAGAGRIGDNTVFSLNAVFVTPFSEFTDKTVWYLQGM